MAVEENDEDAVADVRAEVERLEEILAVGIPPHVQRRNGRQQCLSGYPAGSGGTEAQIRPILLRMYPLADHNGFEATIMELSAGEVAGIKSATIHVKGDYAFGWLCTETGVHRPVRKSL